jgi:hypothetical protein
MVYPGGKDTQPPCGPHSGPQGRSALFRELGIATQRSIARDIIERSGRLPEHASAQLITSFRRGLLFCFALPFAFTFVSTFP